MTEKETMKNLNFIVKAFVEYSELNPVWLLYLAAVLYLLIAGSREARRIFLVPLGVQLLTVFNPLFVGILVNQFGFRNRYLRLFWLLLFFLTVAYVGTCLIFRFSGKKIRGLALVLIVAVICLVGRPVFGEGDLTRYRKVENIHFTFNDVVQLKEILHGEGIERPRVLFDGWLMCNYRTYDPSVRGDMMREFYRKLERWDKEKFLSKRRVNDTIKTIYRVFYYEDYETPVEDFKNAVQQRGLHYIVAPKATELGEYLQSGGMTMIGESASYEVWRL